MIRTLASKIKEGTKFFIGHGETNSHGGRIDVGTVIASFVKEIRGKVSNVIIGHFPDATKVKDMDAVSMEAGISVSSFDDSIVDDITGVSGIALANSDINSPAFPGALRLSSIQCFNTEKINLEKEIIMGDHIVTFQEVQTFVKEHNVWPHQLYDESQLKGDREFGKLFESNDTLSTEVKKLKEDLDTSKNETKKLSETQQAGVAVDRLKELFPKDLTDKQKTFITTKFKPELLDDLSDDNIKKYIEEGRKDFAETAKLFGVADGKQTGTGTKEGKSTKDGKSEETEAGESTPDTEALKLIGVE